jgi:hypothetical protein
LEYILKILCSNLQPVLQRIDHKNNPVGFCTGCLQNNLPHPSGTPDGNGIILPGFCPVVRMKANAKTSVNATCSSGNHEAALYSITEGTEIYIQQNLRSYPLPAA